MFYKRKKRKKKDESKGGGERECVCVRKRSPWMGFLMDMI
jgi:hypothetical protein